MFLACLLIQIWQAEQLILQLSCFIMFYALYSVHIWLWHSIPSFISVHRISSNRGLLKNITTWWRYSKNGMEWKTQQCTMKRTQVFTILLLLLLQCSILFIEFLSLFTFNWELEQQQSSKNINFDFLPVQFGCVFYFSFPIAGYSEWDNTIDWKLQLE